MMPNQQLKIGIEKAADQPLLLLERQQALTSIGGFLSAKTADNSQKPPHFHTEGQQQPSQNTYQVQWPCIPCSHNSIIQSSYLTQQSSGRCPSHCLSIKNKSDSLAQAYKRAGWRTLSQQLEPYFLCRHVIAFLNNAFLTTANNTSIDPYIATLKSSNMSAS